MTFEQRLEQCEGLMCKEEIDSNVFGLRFWKDGIVIH